MNTGLKIKKEFSYTLRNELIILDFITYQTDALGFTFWINVILSPFIIILPICFLFLVFMCTSSASSNTMFMYSSNPTMCPSIRRFTFSYSQICTRLLFCKYLKIRLMGCTITFWTFGGPLYAILNYILAIKFRFIVTNKMLASPAWRLSICQNVNVQHFVYDRNDADVQGCQL